MGEQQLTVVLSRWPNGDPDKRRREVEVVNALRRDAQLAVTIVPHLYYLRPDEPALRALAAARGELIVIAWLYPRATEWTLAHHGIRQSPDRRITCLDLRADVDAPALVAQVRRVAGSRLTGARPLEVGDAGRTPGRRWYPVLDLSRCTNCLECIDFCLFGVYGIDEQGHVFVEDADACKTDCPACSRVCPTDAIMFPECPTPLIAGAPRDQAGTDAAAGRTRSGPVVTLTLGARDHPDSPQPAEAEPTRQDKLDALIDELEQRNR